MGQGANVKRVAKEGGYRKVLVDMSLIDTQGEEQMLYCQAECESVWGKWVECFRLDLSECQYEKSGNTYSDLECLHYCLWSSAKLCSTGSRACSTLQADKR